jgi:XTP/dITP diphosphohydrolase
MVSQLPPIQLVLASANPDKAAEIEEILAAELADAVELVARPASVPDVEETGESLEENARLKADALLQATGLGAVADDSGLEVDALGGAPGVRSARYAGEDATYAANVAKLLGALDGVTERGARFRTVALARLADGRELVCEGVVEGRIAERPSGGGGFGYDPVFVPDEGGGLSFGEMTNDAKHAISARGRAFRALARALLAVVAAQSTGD